MESKSEKKVDIRKIYNEYAPDILNDDENMHKIKNIIENLDPCDKALFVLYTDTGSIYKVGHMLKIHPTTIYSHIIRIKKIIKERYEK